MSKKKLIWQLPFLALLIIGTVYIVHRQHNAPYQHDTGFIFGTVYNVTYQSDEDLQPEIEAELRKVDKSLSMFNKTSTISLINKNKNVTCDPKFIKVFNLAEYVSKETGGAFDITVAPMVNEWGFGFKTGKKPTKQVIDSLKDIVGYQKVKLVNRHVIKQNPNMMLDCSGIAKGFGSDCVANYFRRKGITNFMIEIGGEIVASGISDKRVPWKIGVTKPTDDSLNTNQAIETVLNVTDCGMATSGNYRNFYYKNGKKYAHTIDPHTGYPVQHNILSSTVIAKDCATADAYATSFMVLGLKGSQKVLERHPELMVYFVYDKNGKMAVWYSPGMRKKII